jgi:hypothetical protein
MHRFWWLAGKPIAWRIESEFKDHFKAHNIRGEWFRLAISEAENFVEASIRKLGTWSIRQDDMIGLMDHWERKKFSLPPEAPSPLRGLPR